MTDIWPKQWLQQRDDLARIVKKSPGRSDKVPKRLLALLEEAYEDDWDQGREACVFGPLGNGWAKLISDETHYDIDRAVFVHAALSGDIAALSETAFDEDDRMAALLALKDAAAPALETLPAATRQSEDDAAALLAPVFAPEQVTRDYFTVEDEDGRRFWLFREGLYAAGAQPRWFLHGFFA